MQDVKRQQALYLTFARAFQSLQTAATSVVIPILEPMLQAKENPGLMREAARSIYVDLTAAPLALMGPFMSGTTCLGQIQGRRFGGNATAHLEQILTKKTPSEKEKAEAMVISNYAAVEALYAQTYYNARQALLAKGIYKQMKVLAAALDTDNEALVPKELTQVVPDDSAKFFGN